MLTIGSIEDLKAAVGTEIGTSDLCEIDQDRIDRFAAVTEDFNFIHVDPVRAAETPFGSTIAHGLLTLGLGPKFMYELLDFGGVVGVNYGYGKVRFPAAVKSGSRLRMSATLAAAGEGVSSVDDDEGLSFANRLSLGAEDLGHGAAVGGVDRDLHLHRLEDQQGVADRGLDLPDFPVISDLIGGA